MCSLWCDNAFLEYTEDVVEYFLNLPSMCPCRSHEESISACRALCRLLLRREGPSACVEMRPFLSEGRFSRSLLDSSAMMETFLFPSAPVAKEEDCKLCVGSVISVGEDTDCCTSSRDWPLGWFFKSLKSKGYSFIAAIRTLVLRIFWNSWSRFTTKKTVAKYSIFNTRVLLRSACDILLNKSPWLFTC